MVRFVPEAYQKVKFEKMFDEISKYAKLTTEIIKNCTERAFFDWEMSSGQEISVLFSFKAGRRIKEIDKIGTYFRSYLEPILNSRKIINRSVNIATRSLENMYIKP
ncbi:hypothetical protein NEF87_001304 [Candidatus Lokiarchaeum ossiferum]|uniref:Uncharacterized protein n=1 Tax=Candidatus Lokiarchaeum ossiferum TaxID=2951803 RepID=A0ABY6HR15_9ARCH|nr:hypothetical protein NEF87_001304 [Candidatus Lokiarchaeum sp. B-35]